MIQRFGQNLLCIRLLEGFDQVLYVSFCFLEFVTSLYHIFLGMIHCFASLSFQGHGLNTYIHEQHAWIKLLED